MSGPKLNERPVIGQTSVEVQQLVDILASTDVGTLLRYTELSRAIGRDVQVNRHLLDSARRITMRDYKCVFAAVASEGIRRLDDVETVEICSETRRKRIRTQARNGVRELSTVDYSALPYEKQATHNAGMAVLGGIYAGSSRSHFKKLVNKVENDGMPPKDELMKLIGWE